MGFRKYQSVEKVEVLPPKDQHRIASSLKKIGKPASELTSEERRKAFDS